MYVALYSEREEVRLQQRRVRDVPSGSVPFLRRPCKRAAKPRTGRTSSGPPLALPQQSSHNLEEAAPSSFLPRLGRIPLIRLLLPVFCKVPGIAKSRQVNLRKDGASSNGPSHVRSKSVLLVDVTSCPEGLSG